MSKVTQRLCLATEDVKKEMRESRIVKWAAPMSMMGAYLMAGMSVAATGAPTTTGELFGEGGTLLTVINQVLDGVQPLLIPIAVVSLIIAIICWINPFSQDGKVWTRKIAVVLGGVFLACIIGALFNFIGDATTGSHWTAGDNPLVPTP